MRNEMAPTFSRFGQRPSRRSGESSTRPRLSLRPSALLTWLFVTVILATGPLPLAVRDQSTSTYFSAAALGGFAVLGALLASLRLRTRQLQRAGLDVDRIELGLTGRVVYSGELASPGDLRRVGWAGPAALGAGALALALIGGLMSLASSPGLSLLSATAIASAIGVGALALIDLVPTPGSPGSQLIFARVWRRSGDRANAAVAAARAGVISGWGLLAAGAATVALVGFVGIWLMLMGGLVIGASRLALMGARARQRLMGLRVADVMSPAPPEVSAFATVAEALTNAGPIRSGVVVVRESDGSFGGVVSQPALLAVPGDDRDELRVRRLATPPAALAIVAATDPIERALETMAAHAVAGVPGVAVVFDELDETHQAGHPDANPHVVGIVTVADLNRTLNFANLAPGGTPTGKL
jgi:CBS domain-containing protein